MHFLAGKSFSFLLCRMKIRTWSSLQWHLQYRETQSAEIEWSHKMFLSEFFVAQSIHFHIVYAIFLAIQIPFATRTRTRLQRNQLQSGFIKWPNYDRKKPFAWIQWKSDEKNARNGKNVFFLLKLKWSRRYSSTWVYFLLNFFSFSSTNSHSVTL